MQQKAYIQSAFVAADQKKALWQMLLVLFALALTLAQYFTILPEWLFRVPAAVLPPLERWLDAFFNFVKDDLKLIVLTQVEPYKSIELTYQAIPDSVRVFVDGELYEDWHYVDFENTVYFDIIPEGDKLVEVGYRYYEETDTGA